MPHDQPNDPAGSVLAVPKPSRASKDLKSLHEAAESQHEHTSIENKRKMAAGHKTLAIADAAGSPPELQASALDSLNSAYPAIDDSYRLIRTIGKGNFAAVYLAQHLITGILVAVKIISKKQCKNHQLVCLCLHVHFQGIGSFASLALTLLS